MSEQKTNQVSQFPRRRAGSRSLSEKLGDRGAGGGVDGRPFKKYILYDTAWKSLRFLKISRARPPDGIYLGTEKLSDAPAAGAEGDRKNAFVRFLKGPAPTPPLLTNQCFRTLPPINLPTPGTL